MEGIMVSAATGVMNSLLGKLTSLLTEKYKLQKRVKRDITSLQEELRSINALKKFAEREELDPQMKEWRSWAREMAYDIEDCIDKYMRRLQNEPDKPSGIKKFLKKKINKVKNLVGRSEIAEEIQEIRNRIAEAGRRRKTYNFDAALSSGGTSVVPMDPRMPALHVEAENLVGIDGPRNKLVKFVSDVEKMPEVKVVSIVGVGGLGKTTLAGQVYGEIAGLFDCRASLSVSQEPDITEILRTIHSQVTKNHECAETNTTDDKDGLIAALRDFLKKKRYVIVIDDIWSSEAWMSIKCALPENRCGSSIIVTTRNVTVAKSCCSLRHDLVYELSPLSEYESTGLFFRRIYGSENECPSHLKKVAVEIIRKCGGLPLAIITMASLLTTKSDKREEWVSVRSSIGVGLEKDSEVERMRKILSLSYNDLPYHLKTCFLYLSIFPEDYNINSDRLVRRWIAEGFIQAQGGRTLEEEGECCLNELINRSLIKPVMINYSGQVKTCRVHDMFLDLIISKAGEENFVRFINQKDVVVPDLKVRRLSLDYRDQECTAISGMDISQARSISIFGCSQQQMPLFTDFSALRVVDIEGQLNCDQLMNIEELFQLRYLRLSARSIEQLSQQLGKLQLLETLDVEQTSVRELPASIVQLQHLKNLLVRNARLPAGISKMRSLQKHSQLFVDDSCSVTSLLELGSLTNLRFLGLFWGISDSDADKINFAANLVSALRELGRSNLRFLSVSSEESDGSLEFMFDAWSSPSHLLQELTLYPNWYVCKSPRWIASMDSLNKLDIMVNPVTQEALDIFGDLPFLLFLELTSKVSPRRAYHLERYVPMSKDAPFVLS